MIDYTFTPASTFNEGLVNLYEIVKMLRSPDGCPWDREQNYKKVATNLLDETYEYLDAVMEEDPDGM
ncbi:MAG: nucleoside triphosphate pyrophosphohydrolase, partial [Sphaerochaetaceae bacterium]|nr:nucleoside triphosphate pyrophosphohydrolase [Sphaerochaetaceae bacterium]